MDLWNVVVKVFQGCRPHVFLESKLKVDITWTFNCRRDAINLSGRYEFSFNFGATERAPYLASVLEISSRDPDMSATSDRSFSWLQLEEQRRLVIVEDLLVISVFDTVEGNLNARLMPIVARW